MGASDKDFNNNTVKTRLPVIAGAFEVDPQGNVCPVIDLSRIDVTGAVLGRKKDTTRVIRVPDNFNGGAARQIFEGGDETFPHDCQPGEALFINSETDMYVPPSKDGGRLMFDDLEANDYKITSGDKNEVQVLSPPAGLLIQVVDARVCIRNAWGAEDNPENHQFLSEGATLKVVNGIVASGIDEKGMEKWGDENGHDFPAVVSALAGAPKATHPRLNKR